MIWRGWERGLALLTLVFLYAPIAVLVVFSFNDSRSSAAWQGVSWRWYGELIRDASLWAALHNSLIVASVSSLASTILGVAAALALERRPATTQRMLVAGLLLPLVVPEVMLGISLLLFFVIMHVPLGLLTVTIGHIVFNLPVVLVVMRARLRRLDPALHEAALDLGATPWQALYRVSLPLLWPAIAGALLMAFTVSMDDFIVTFFTAGPGSTTLPLKVYSMIRSGVSPVVNALSASLVLVSMAFLTLALLLQRTRLPE